MRSAIAIITYRRRHAIQAMLESLFENCDYPVGVFEDCGMADDTRSYLVANRKPTIEASDEFLADIYRLDDMTVFLGTENLGVAGNSNRALRWFEQTGCDHLCLCNDDLLVQGDFPKHYAQAHQDLGIDFFCFNDFWKWPSHRWSLCRSRGYRLRIFRQMTGIMMSVTKAAFNRAGYFDTRFRQFGQEHCDWTNRMRFTGGMKLDGIDQPCIDVEPTNPDGSAAAPVLVHQECETSIVGEARKRADDEALEALQVVASRYQSEPYYRKFALREPNFIGGLAGQGIPSEQMASYERVTCS